jgi:hypothetical protein
VSLVVSTSVILVASNGWTDEECYKGYRDVTPSESAAMMTVLESALKTMPPAPGGWEVSRDDMYVTQSVCRDDESNPWGYDSYRTYARVDDRDARDQILSDAGAQTSADMKAKQPRMDAVMARIQELSLAAVAAAEKGDYDKVDEINVEIQEASDEMERIMAEGGTLDRIDEATDAANRDTQITITVDVNSGHGLFGYGAEETTVPPGADGAYRWIDTEGSVVNETRLILFGGWRTDGESFDPVFRAGAAPTAAQAISFRITADESRIDSVVDAIDFRTVAASVAR